MSIQDYEHPALTADVVLLGLGRAVPSVLLIQRDKQPFQGAWAYPGGFVAVGEPPERAASRELHEETGIQDVHLEQLRAFGDPERDPRGHVVTVAYLAVVKTDASPETKAGSDAGEVHWWPIDALPNLAFDHPRILNYALQRILSELGGPPIGRGLGATLPGGLSLRDLRRAYGAIAAKLEKDTAGEQLNSYHHWDR